MSKKLSKCLSLVLAIMLLASLSVFGTLNASADYKTGDGLAAYAMQAYNEGWRYVWGGASYGAVDCSGLIYSYVGGGARVTEDMLYSSPESGYVSNGVPDIPGLGLWQPGHVGVYIGNGMAVDARDEISNVCYSAVSSKSWVMWFKVAGVTYGGETSVANNNQKTEKTDSAPSDTVKSVENQILSLGSQGTDVNALQERLKELGYFADNTTDYFGTVTQSALTEFQISAGLTADGILTEEVKTVLFADNAPAKLSSSNVNPEESTESDNEVSDENIATETDSITDADSEGDTQLEEENVLDNSDTESEISDTDIMYRVGDDDEEITNIQFMLILLGYYDYDLTTEYDDNTAYAVAQYQLDHNLDATGFVDSKTLDSLYDNFGKRDSEADTDTDNKTDVVTTDSESAADEILEQPIADENDTYDDDDCSDNVYDEPFYDETESDSTVDDDAESETDEEFAEENNKEESPTPQRSFAASNENVTGEDAETALTTVEETVSDADSTDNMSNTDNTSSASDTSSVSSASDTVSSGNTAANSNTTSSGSANVTATGSVNSNNGTNTANNSSSSNSEVKPADVPQTGVITLYSKTAAAVGIIISLMVIFFVSNVHYWNVSMEKRKQRARKAVSVSAYRRSSR